MNNMMSDFENYMLTVHERTDEFTYSEEVIESNREYFKEAYDKHLSPYKALTLFYYYLLDK